MRLTRLNKFDQTKIADMEDVTGLLIHVLSARLLIFYNEHEVVWQLQKKKDVLVLINGTKKYYADSTREGLNELLEKIK